MTVPTEIIDVILSHIVPVGGKLEWHKRYDIKKEGIDVRLLLVSKAFKNRCDDMFYSKNTFRFLYEDGFCRAISGADARIISRLRSIELTSLYSAGLHQLEDNATILRLWTDCVRNLRCCTGLDVLRLRQVGFMNWQCYIDPHLVGSSWLKFKPEDYRLGLEAVRLLMVIECPSALLDGDVFCHGEQRECTVTRKGFRYECRPMEIRMSKKKLLAEARLVEKETAEQSTRV